MIDSRMIAGISFYLNNIKYDKKAATLLFDLYAKCLNNE